jgi:hypothetical protein
MDTKAKRIGRPLKAPTGKRAQLSLLVRAEIKRYVDKAAQKSGRTQSQEAEHLIERALTYDRMLEAMRTTLDAINRGNIEAAFRSQGYKPFHTPHGKGWVPKGYPIKESGFIPPEEEKQ